MNKQTKKPYRPELLAYRQGDYVGLHVYIPVKWVLMVALLIVVKLLPEWWEYIQTILPLLK